MYDLVRLMEPQLLFAHNQTLEDPRDGLSFHGPFDKGSHGINYGLIGTERGIKYFNKWLREIQGPVIDDSFDFARPPFPGFEAAFGISWEPNPRLEIAIPEAELLGSLWLDDRHQRVFKTVDSYSRRILKALSDEDSGIHVWIVVVPDDVYKYCRPNSMVAANIRVKAENKLNPKTAQHLQNEPSFFEKDNLDSIPYYYDVNFHNQLKGRLLESKIPIQIVRESTIAPAEVVNAIGKPLRKLSGQLSAIAWNLSTTVFYKCGGRPWKLATIRKGVCYVGLVFKQINTDPDPKSACCAAQMFMDSGDGVVFRGAVGPWYRPGKGDFHLKPWAAKQLIGMAIESYKNKNNGTPPSEMFVHGRVRFEDDEWKGFLDAIDSRTKIVGVRIRQENDLRLYKKSDHAVLRGLAYIRDERTAFLWSKGFIPRLQTYPGREVPKPLLIDICRGRTEISIVLNDIMSLTKLNYNSCIFADGDPVTLVFADAVGEILTSGPIKEAPLAFKFYI